MTKTVDDLEYSQRTLAKQKVRIFNPDDKDFTVKWHGEPVTARALEIGEFEYHVAQHIKKHLATHLVNKKGIAIPTDEDRQEVIKQIEVSYD